MHPFRRVLSGLSGLLILQLTLLGAAAPCADAAHVASTGAAANAHVVELASPAEDCAEHSAAPSKSKRSGSPSCLAMISCVTAIPQLSAQPGLGAGVIAGILQPPPTPEPSTRNTVPEPPPPRA